MVNKKYLRAKEVAEYLSIGLSTVWLYAKEGKLTPKKISNRVTVFDIEELNNLLMEVA
jgi:predicted DNA-binding transcriptional regulator AlpA